MLSQPPCPRSVVPPGKLNQADPNASCTTLFAPFLGTGHAQVFAAHPDCSASNSRPSVMDSAHRAALRRARRRESTRFSKRRRTYIKGSHKLSKDCNAQVFTVVKKDNKFYVYNSAPQDVAWPPSYAEIVRSQSLVKRNTNINTHIVKGVSCASGTYSNGLRNKWKWCLG
ncbi:Transcription factor- MADS-box [Apiospora rasikravindrae]|uniref:Transcription factor- MADS-box n=1 Tax=Apiospora rasikravindrae TaxID=990691 RepID=A0ABR1SPS5_9PEZI